MKSTSGRELESEWDPLVETLAAMITLASEYVVLQVETRYDGDCGPYVQSLQEENGALTLEAVSNAFIDPPLGPDAINTLLELGWSTPDDEDGFPNFRIFLDSEQVEPGHVARFLVLTLRDAFLVTPEDTFELAPSSLFVEVVHGEFGERPGLKFKPVDLDKLKRMNRRWPESP